MSKTIMNFHGLTLAILFCIIAINNSCIMAHPPTTTAAPLKSTYNNKFDNVNLDEILQQESLLKNYMNCLERTGPCTGDGKMLRDTLPDLIQTNCAKCTERQKYVSAKIIRFLIDNRPEDWQRLEKIYDPQGTYRKAYLVEKKQQPKVNTDMDKDSKEE